ncbi:sirohydrochlorin cobaltochelatase [Pelosinus sp. sgz500959]|uniref:sirohydrochlorin cobaltochelatase n=1 Tax=Pelosinus sp. sgz500959 TaxID=3242472 RepID=UPI003671BCA1
MKKAIVVVGTNTNDYDILKAGMESIEDKIKGKFPDYEVRRAISSPIVIGKIAPKNDLQLDTTQQVLRRLQREGYQEVIFISLKESYLSTPEYHYDDPSDKLNAYII